LSVNGHMPGGVEVLIHKEKIRNGYKIWKIEARKCQKTDGFKAVIFFQGFKMNLYCWKCNVTANIGRRMEHGIKFALIRRCG